MTRATMRLDPRHHEHLKLVVERFSIDCRKTKTKAITPTNHNGNKQLHEQTTIPSNYL